MECEACTSCAGLRAALKEAQARAEKLEAELCAAHAQIRELDKMVRSQGEDLKRYRDAARSAELQNYPERANGDALQLAFEHYLKMLKDPRLRKALEEAKEAANDGPEEDKPKPTKKRKSGNRRKLSETNLPVIEERITPAEVLECQGEGWKLISEEVTERIVLRKARFERLRVVRETWTPVDEKGSWQTQQTVTAPIPEWVLPRRMADPSVIADIALAKYGFNLPWNRQENMHRLQGFDISRSTMSDWIECGYNYVHPIVTAMHQESLTESYIIATNATGAPVRISGGRANWHLFVFIADTGHITFRPTRRHDGASIMNLLSGFEGALLSDAHSAYNVLYTLGVTALYCWSHCRRYFWKAIESESELANEALALIKQIFDIERKSKRMPLKKRTAFRALHAKPVIEALDLFVEQALPQADEGGRLRAAITYYKNQREGLVRFLEDGRIAIDNNGSERELRNLVTGRKNWMHFETKAGLNWYADYRSLISSCKLHHINPYAYLEQVLRLARHWPDDRMIELSPKCWNQTVRNLDPRHREIIHPPWKSKQAKPPSEQMLEAS